jgi:hypothetical protein
MKPNETDQRPDRFASLIGDLVASRRAEERRGLHERVLQVMEQVNARTDQVQPLTFTVGDEFQALYRDLPDAIEATLLMRLHLVGVSEVRFGLGWGTVEVFDAEHLPFQQDGPAWWAARRALELVARAQKQREMPKGWRTAFVDAEDDGRSGVVDAFLICREALLDGMDERDAGVLLGLLAGQSQGEIAAAQGVTQPAISQRSARNGTYAILRARSMLKEGVVWTP